MRLILATGNPDKARELEALLPGTEVETAPQPFDPEETGVTLFQNAWIKAAALRAQGADAMVVADDSGLEVRALDGRPGVFSSRYAGPGASYEDNRRRLLEELEGADDRRAAFVCVLVGMAPARAGWWSPRECARGPSRPRPGARAASATTRSSCPTAASGRWPR